MSRYVAVLVKIIGNPVTDKPSDTAYQFIIWDFTDVQSRCTIDQLHVLCPTIEFQLTATVDPRDLEHMYSDVCKQYNDIIMRVERSTFTFKSLTHVGPDSYLKDMKERVQTLLNTDDRDTM